MFPRITAEEVQAKIDKLEAAHRKQLLRVYCKFCLRHPWKALCAVWRALIKHWFGEGG